MNDTRSDQANLPAAIASASKESALRDALTASETMANGILDALGNRIAILDANGVIVAVNRAWQAFGEMPIQLFQSSPAAGTDYGGLLQAAAEAADPATAHDIHALLQVIRGDAAGGEMPYTVSAGGHTRWFVVRAVRLGPRGAGTVISHEESTDRMLSHVAMKRANQRLQMLSKRVLTVNEEERRFISCELHDDIGQSLTALKIGLHRIAQRVDGELEPMVAHCLQIAGTTLDTVRNLSHELRPPQLDQLGIEDALDWLVSRQRTATGLEINCRCNGLPSKLPTAVASACYRIAQEAIANVSRHARARRVEITVEATPHLLKLAIRDDGVGFDEDEVRQRALKSGSLGLISMEERAQLAGGQIRMRTVRGAGTTINATFALDPESLETA